MRLACNISLMFTEVPLLNRFQKAAEAGFKTVEIQFPYEESPEALKEAKEAAGVDVCLINVPAGDLMSGGEGLACVPGKEKEFEEALKLCAKYVKALNVSRVNVLPGRCEYAGQEAVYLATLKKNLKKAATALQKIHVLCVFEAINTRDMPNFLVHSADQMMEIVEELDHPNLKMQYDIYHMQIMDGRVDDAIRHHVHEIGHIQFADVPGRGQPDSGNLNFKAIFKAIEESGYHGYVSAEYNPTHKTRDSLDWLETYDLEWLASEIRYD